MSKVDDFTRNELRATLRSKGLSVSGTKDELFDRLAGLAEVPKVKKKAKKKGKKSFLGWDLKVTPINKILRDRAAYAPEKKAKDTKEYLKKRRAELKARKA